MKLDKAFLRTLFFYGIIGAISAGFDTAVFAVLVNALHFNEFVSNVISVHCGIFLSFFLNSRYNFRKTDQLKTRFAAFYLTGLFGLGLSSLILFLGQRIGADILLTKMFSVVFVALVQFFINRAAAFGDKR